VIEKEIKMSNDSLLTPVTNATHSTHVEYPDGSQPTSSLTQQESKEQAVQAAAVPTDEKSIILGLIEYLKRGAEYSGENQAQAEWFLFCSDWVKVKYEASGLSDANTSPSGPWFNQ
jgi:hypothetical protein